MVQINGALPLKGSRITGIGSALVDLLIYEPDHFLVQLGKEKGGMTLVNALDIDGILMYSEQVPAVVPGGAACNTIVGVACLGGRARFIGKRGEDDYGQLYETALVDCRVETKFFLSETPTGTVLSVITPDAQRSMFTCLGAATELMPDQVDSRLFEDTAIAVVEGYLLFNPDLMMACLESARASGALIALDLASFEVVNSTRPLLEKIITDYVDILIANEDEALAYTGHRQPEAALAAMGRKAPLAALKLGAKGSWLTHPDTGPVRVSPHAGKSALDTTGAGDLWAAGFLYGLTHGFSLAESGALGSLLGYEVCQVVGAHIPESRWAAIREHIEKRQVL